MSLCPGWLTHRVISDRVHRLLVTLFYFRPDRFVQFLSLIPILILLLCFLVSKDLVHTGILERLEERKRQLLSKLSYKYLAETKNIIQF